MNDLITATEPSEASALSLKNSQTLINRAREHAENAYAENTRLAYGQAWRRFHDWCASSGVCSMPATGDVVALFITHLEMDGYSAASIQLQKVAIGQAHQTHGYPDPCRDPGVEAVWKGIRKGLGGAQEQKAPILAETLKLLLGALDPRSNSKLRDRAILLLGYAAALRRSEIVSLDVRDLVFSADGVAITIRRSKTDQMSIGHLVGVVRTHGDYCPVAALEAWLESAGIDDGPVFRSIERWSGRLGDSLTDRSIADIIKKAAERAGLDPSQFAGHSLRAGHVTQAAMNGVDLLCIADQTRHTSLGTLRKYVRKAELFKRNSSAGVGL